MKCCVAQLLHALHMFLTLAGWGPWAFPSRGADAPVTSLGCRTPLASMDLTCPRQKGFYSQGTWLPWWILVPGRCDYRLLPGRASFSRNFRKSKNFRRKGAPGSQTGWPLWGRFWARDETLLTPHQKKKKQNFEHPCHKVFIPTRLRQASFSWCRLPSVALWGGELQRCSFSVLSS